MWDTGSGATVVIMSHTDNRLWPEREPKTLLITAYQRQGQWMMLVQEHNNTVHGALRPDYVGTFALWQSGTEGLPTNRDVVLAVEDALTRMLSDSARLRMHRNQRS